MGAPLQVDDVDIFDRFILKFKSSSTMRLHFIPNIFTVCLPVQGKLFPSLLIATTHYKLHYTIILYYSCICSAAHFLPHVTITS